MSLNPKVLVIAPHPDDECLGVGGTILKHVEYGHDVAWLICTKMPSEDYDELDINKREQEINFVKHLNKFSDVFRLNFDASYLDTIPIKVVIEKVRDILNSFKPDIIYAPNPSDAHSDHQIIFKAVAANCKLFRNSTLKKLYTYETLSETDANISPLQSSFNPNFFNNITSFLEKKIEIMLNYESEFHEFPFPRSEKSIRALANLRGSQAGFSAAEAFMLIISRSAD